MRKYNEVNPSLSFTSTTVGQEEKRPQCVGCLKILAADTMKPTYLRRRLETHQPDHVNLIRLKREYDPAIKCGEI